MAKPKTLAEGRIEVTFFGNDASQRVIMDEIDKNQTAYGAKKRFLRDSLMRGYLEIVSVINEINTSTELEDRLSKKLDSGHYHLLRLLMDQDVGAGESIKQPQDAKLLEAMGNVPEESKDEVKDDSGLDDGDSNWLSSFKGVAGIKTVFDSEKEQ